MLTKIDVEVITGLMFLSTYVLVITMAWRGNFPSVDQLLELSTLFNAKGGIIMALWVAWIFTLMLTVGFGMWVIVRGVDPQHTVVTVIFGMLISQAFGGVNGVLFKTMTGEDPKINGKSSVATTSTLSTTSTTTTPDPATPEVKS